MGRAMQDIRLCKKYHVNVAIFTLAKNKYSMRAMEDMKSLCRVLGMDGKEAKNAIGCINIKFINEKKG